MFVSVVMLLTSAVADTDRVVPDTLAADTVRVATASVSPRAFAAADVPQRRKAIAYSEWYGRRLTVHRWGSYAMLPLFATEYWLGHKLLNDDVVSSSTRDAHATVASGLGVLFAVNTATGLWNAWDARHDASGRGKRLVHSALLLAADAGFLYTASLADDDDEEGGGRGGDQRIRHRNAALVSIGLSTVGTGLMWFFKD